MKDVKILQCFCGKVNPFQPVWKGRAPMKKGPVIIFANDRPFALPRATLMQTAQRIYSREKISCTRKTHVIVCSDYIIKKLNGMFRGKNRATDVLSFNYDDNDLLGEIYISRDRAGVQARRYGVSRDNEILRLFIHGMFHLLGFDHETEPDRRKMEAKESTYLKHP
jgi:probable rRNA maturation factor